MNPRNAEQREELLIGLMADYDEALAADVPTDRIDETLAQFDPQLAAEWDGVKQCLELLNRAWRSGDLERVLPDPTFGGPGRAAGPRQIGRFILERELGRGGLGIVYLAHDPQLGRKVALKIPRFEALLDDNLRRRFLREAEAVARLNHPHIVALHEVGEDGSICFLASEYCRGLTLAQWLRARSEPVAHVEAAELVLTLAGAVDHAHSRGVLHRDIKPSNVLLSEAGDGTREGNSWTPKLTDFGMAKLLEQDGGDRTRTGAIVGTLAYMAPEQAEGRTDQFDARTDVYSLGAVLYELVTGVAPYGGQTDIETLRQLIVSEPVAPRKLRPDVPRDLEAVARKCLANNRASRYSTASDLAADLRRFLDGRPTAARPQRAPGRVAKWVKRRPAIAALWLVSILAVALAVGINARRHDVGLAIKESDRLRIIANDERQRATDRQTIASRFLYASRMRDAQQAWREGNLTRLEEILANYSGTSPEAALRHFEWYHLNHLANLPHRVHLGHAGEVYAVAYAPDGQAVLTGGQDGAVCIWDVASGEQLAILREHATCVNSIDFSPDGDTFVTASCDKTIKLWSLSGRSVLATLTDSHDVYMAMFMDGGKLLASRSNSSGVQEACIWNVATRSVLSDWPPTEEPIDGFAPAASGQTLVTLADDKLAVWKRQGKSWALSHRCSNVNSSYGAVLSPDAEYVLVPNWRRYLKVFRLRDGALTHSLSDHMGGIDGMSFSPQGDRLATASADGSVGIFSFPSCKLEHRLLGHAGRVWNVAWSPGGDSVASVGSDGSMRIWDLKRGSSRLHLAVPSDMAPVHEAIDIAYLRDGRHVNAAYRGCTVVWDVQTGRRLPMEEVHGTLLRIVNTAKYAAFFEAAHPLLAQWDPKAYAAPPRDANTAQGRFCVRISSDGSAVLETCAGRMRTWSFKPWEIISEKSIKEFKPPYIILDISHDGARVCGLGDSGIFEIHDLNQGDVIRLSPMEVASNACFSPNGERILVTSQHVREFNAFTGAHVHDFPHEYPQGVTYSADGQRIAIASGSGYVAIHDAITGEETLRLEVGGDKVVFARDGTSLLTTGAPDYGLFLRPGKKDAPR